MPRIVTFVALSLALACVVARPASAAPAPPPAPVAHASFSFAKAVCDLAAFPAKVGATKLIKLVTEEEVAVVVVQLALPLGKAWCAKQLPKVKAIFKQAVVQKPSFRSRLGPLVWGVQATGTYGSSTDAITPTWYDYDPTSPIATKVVFYSLDGGSWYRLYRPSLLVPRGHNVSFAVRVNDQAGYWSPWAYSGSYHAN